MTRSRPDVSVDGGQAASRNRVSLDDIDVAEQEIDTYVDGDVAYELPGLGTLNGNYGVSGGSYAAIDSIEADTAVNHADVLAVGDIEADTVMTNAIFSYVISDGTVTADALGSNVNGALLIADRAEIEDYDAPAFVLTGDPDDPFPTYHGDMDALRDRLQDDPFQFLGLQAFLPDINSITDYDELLETAAPYNRKVAGMSRNDLQKVAPVLNKFRDSDIDRQEAVIRSLDGLGSDLRTRRVYRFFRNVYDHLEPAEQDELVAALDGSQDGVTTLVDTVAAGKHYLFLEDTDPPLRQRGDPGPEVDTVRSLLRAADIPDTDTILEELYDVLYDAESPYREDDTLRDGLHQLYEDVREDLATVEHRARAAGETVFPYVGGDGGNLRLDAEQLLKKWEGRHQHTGALTEIDIDELEQIMRDDLAEKERTYLQEALRRRGEDRVMDWYVAATGESPPEDGIDEHMVAALQVYAHHAMDRTRGKRFHPAKKQWQSTKYGRARNLEASELVLRGKEPETHPANEAWLEEYGFDAADMYPEPATYDLATVAADVGLGDAYDRLAAQVDSLDTVTVRPADPLETMRMGELFDTCFAPEQMHGGSAAAVAADINKQAIYIEAGDAIAGRVTAAVTADGELTHFRNYPENELVNHVLTDYLSDWAADLEVGLEPKRGDIDHPVAESSYYSFAFQETGGQINFGFDETPFEDGQVRVKPAPGWRDYIGIKDVFDPSFTV